MWIIVIIAVIVLIVIFSAKSSDTDTKSSTEGSPTVRKSDISITPLKVDPPEMVQIIGDSFIMGSSPVQDYENEDYQIYQRCLDLERPQHRVTVNNFSISKTMITNEQYAVFLNDCLVGSDGIYNGIKLLELDNTYQQLAYIEGCWSVKRNIYGQYIYAGYPMQMVTWFGANEYCKWAGGRLPTEAEWEYAARGGKKSRGYKYAGSNDIEEVAWYSKNCFDYTNIVAMKKPNELGLYDMSGNATEWCFDWFSSYLTEPQNDPTGPSSGSRRVTRNGGGRRCNSIICRVTSRDSSPPNSGGIGLSFRLVLPYDEMNFKGTLEEIKKLAEQGNSEYQYQLGNAYLLGEGIPRNAVIAAEWHKKAASQNHIKAQRSIAYAYKDADGVERNIEEAMVWFEKAAKQGNANSQMMIGNSYYLGVGVQKDKEKASFYLKAAAKQNEKTAIYLLGLFPELNL